MSILTGGPIFGVHLWIYQQREHRKAGTGNPTFPVRHETDVARQFETRSADVVVIQPFNGKYQPIE
jgi:hypothetical protein